MSEAYLEVSMVIVNGFEKLGRWRMGCERKNFFSELNYCWQVGGPVLSVVFLGQVKEWVGNSGIVKYKPMIEVGKVQEGAHLLGFGGGWPGSDAIEFDQVYDKLSWFYDHIKIFNFGDVKLTFFEF